MASLISICSIGLLISVLVSTLVISSAGDFYQDFDISWGDGHAKMLNNDELLTLSLAKASGSCLNSKNEYKMDHANLLSLSLSAFQFSLSLTNNILKLR
jgi:xyloglucan:xyloglucosyl transferase